MGQAWRGGLTVGIAVALLAIAFALLYLNLSAAGKAKDVAAIIQSSVTAVAIVVGGIFAYYKLQLFRDLEPHLTISHEVSHRFIGDSYVHIAVTANVYNGSKVKVELNQALFSVQLLSPISDENVESLYEERRDDRDENYTHHIQWPTLDEIEQRWTENELVIEPNGTHPEIVEFILSSDVESVMIYTYFYNLANPSGVPHTLSDSSIHSQGWSMTTAYDIK